MLTRRDAPFPFEAARDLLGILRAMYGAERAGAQNPRRLAAIAGLALELKQALDLALENSPGSLGHAAAWNRAEAVSRGLADVVDMTTPLEPTLDAASRRLRDAAGGDSRSALRRARRSRG